MLLEAMAAGIASVVSDASPGPLEMVRDGRQGLVVPSDDVIAFAAALQRLMLDGDLRHRCGVAAMATLRTLDWDVVESTGVRCWLCLRSYESRSPPVAATAVSGCLFWPHSTRCQ